MVGADMEMNAILQNVQLQFFVNQTEKLKFCDFASAEQERRQSIDEQGRQVQNIHAQFAKLKMDFEKGGPTVRQRLYNYIVRRLMTRYVCKQIVNE